MAVRFRQSHTHPRPFGRTRAVRFACELAKRTLNARFWRLPDDQVLDVGSPKDGRLQIRFSTEQRAAIRDRAERSGQSLSAVVRELVAAALVLDTEAGPRPDSPAALAALMAAELAALMVASVLPDGERRMHELEAQAAAAAEERLAIFRESNR
jgi:hypothetical protein